LENRLNSKSIVTVAAFITIISAVLLQAGCTTGAGGKKSSQVSVDIPAPVNLILPKTIHIHPFTATRQLDDSSGQPGIGVRLEAMDTYGETARAFGDFRFELYAYKPNSLDSRGSLMGVWDIPLSDPDVNLAHWDRITRAYRFKLLWDRPLPLGQKYVLVAIFNSPYTPRLFDQRVIVSELVR